MNAVSIEAKGYIAADSDVEQVTQSIVGATQAIEAGRGNYLKMLVANTIQALGTEPRKRQSGKQPKLDEDGTAKQLKALSDVHERFYAVVTKVVSAAVPAGKDRALEINRKTNFARTAMSVVRRWIKVGNDVTALIPKAVTKAQLAVAATPRAVSAQALATRAERDSKALVVTIMALADADKTKAIEELQLLMDQITTQLLELSTSGATTDMATAMRERRPLRVKKMVFIPTATQVIEQRSKPS